MASAIISALGFRATIGLIPIVQRMTLRRGMFGVWLPRTLPQD
jgi:hypothetical protein